MNVAHAFVIFSAVSVAVAQEPAVVTGNVTDARTHAPLPRYLLELHAGSRFDRITSDEKGHFASSVPFALGDVDVRLVDDDAVERKLMQGGLQLALFADPVVKLHLEGKPLDLAIAAGPTFRLAWKSPAMEGSPTTPATSTAEILWKQASILDPDVTMRAGLRIEADGRTWVRFAPIPDGVQAPSGVPWLSVLSIDGLWKATAPIAVMEAGGKEIALEWKPCARWVGSLKGSDGRGVPGTWVRLERVDEKKTVVERRRTRCDPDGKYAFEGLESGSWKLSGDPLRFRPFESEVREVAAGSVSKLGVALDAEREFKPINGRIEGMMVAEGQAAPGEPSIIVRRGGDPLPQETLRAGWRVDGGRYVALFIVPRLPSGEYELELVPAPSDAGKWSALTLKAKAGSTVIFTQR